MTFAEVEKLKKKNMDKKLKQGKGNKNKNKNKIFTEEPRNLLKKTFFTSQNSTLVN